MSVSANQAEKHPKSAQLALYARSDLSLISRFRIRLHLKKCADCRRQLQSLINAISRTAEDIQNRLRRTVSSPGWQHLSQEMTGNIAVGLAAAQCIEHVDARRRRTLRGVLIGCGLIVLLMLGWMTHIPASDTAKIIAAFRAVGERHSQASGPVASSMASGMTVTVGGTGLKIVTPTSATVFCSGAATLRSSYVDEETGESTISVVYGR